METRDFFLIVRQRSARLVVDDHDLPTGWIRFGSQVNVIEMFSILMAEEGAAIAMVAASHRTGIGRTVERAISATAAVSVRTYSPAVKPISAIGRYG